MQQLNPPHPPTNYSYLWLGQRQLMHCLHNYHDSNRFQTSSHNGGLGEHSAPGTMINVERHLNVSCMIHLVDLYANSFFQLPTAFFSCQQLLSAA